MSGPLRTSFMAALASMSVLTAAPARADTVRACLNQHEAAQVARRDGRYVEALEQLSACTNDACPASVREDCASWYAEVDEAMPTVVVIVRDASGATTAPPAGTTLRIDGVAIDNSASGRAQPIDPGEHTFSATLPNGAVVETTVVIAEGKKNRQVVLPIPQTDTPPPPDDDPGTPHPASYIIGGLGLASLAGFAIVGALGRAKESDLADTCAPQCSDEQLDELRTQYLVADILLASGVVLTTAGITIGLVTALSGGDSDEPAATATPQWRLKLGAGSLMFMGTF